MININDITNEVINCKTKEQLEELTKWRIQHSDCLHLHYNLTRDRMLLSNHMLDKSYFYNGSEENFLLESWNEDYQKITLQQFYKFKLKQKMNRFPFELSIENAKKIIDIACQTWKNKLAEKWGKDLLLNAHVSINETFYKEMREACDSDQHKLFDTIFGADNLEIDLTKPETINKLNLFGDGGTSNLISIRTSDELKNKAFWLNNKFNWELKKDSAGCVCLIPTKK